MKHDSRRRDALGLLILGCSLALACDSPVGSDTVPPPISLQTTLAEPLATDAFNRANENPLAGNWTSGPGAATDLQLRNNAVTGVVASPNGVAFWNAVAWPADQWSEVRIQTLASPDNIGPAVRIDAAVATYYMAIVFPDGGLDIYRSIDHTFTWLLTAGGAGTVVEGDRVRLEAQGTMLRVFRNGVLVGEVEDAAIASGAAGLFDDNTSAALDDWAGGGFAPGPAPAPPAAPTNLAATAVSASQINLGWTDNAANEDGFRIERCAGAGCSAFAEIATVGANVVSYQNTGLTASTSYSYRVRAYNPDGTSAYSNTATAMTATPPPAPPAAPTNLAAAAVSASQINLSWTDNAATESGFRIERCAGAGCSGFVEITTVGANVASYQNTGLTASTSYSYRVRAYNPDGTSAYSNTATATTSGTPPPPPPPAPGPLATDAFNRANENPIAGTWTSGAGAAGDLQVLNNGVQAVSNSTNNTAFWNALTWPADQWSEVTIRTLSSTGNNGVGVRMHATTATYYTALVLADGSLQVWRSIDHSFTLILAAGGAGTVVAGDRVRLEVQGTTLRVYRNGVLRGSVEDTQIATGSAGIGQDETSGALDDWAGGGFAPGPAPAPPAAPTNLAAAAVSTSQIDLTWTDNATNESGFRIERCAGAGCSGFAEIATVGPNVVSYQNTGLTGSTSYSYRVRAYNADGASAYSNTATAMTATLPPTPPAAPSSLAAAAVSASQINLSWTDNAATESGFRIERCAGAGCSGFVEITTVGANVASYQNTGLTASTSYSYRVRAYNGGGTSAYSNTATAMTATPPPAPPAAPTSLAAAAVATNQINLSWTDNATTESGFRIERCAGAGCSGFTEIATVGANVVSYQNTGLTASTSYSYRVRAYNGGGTSSYSNTATATTQAPPAMDRLPDLGMARLSDMRLSQSGGRRLLRYSMTIVNVGAGKFELRGQRASTSESHMSVVQRIFNSTGGSRDVSTAAEMEFGGDGHDHWHVHELALSELFRLDDGVYLAKSDKLGFCFWDNVKYRLSLPGAPQSAVYGESGCGGSGSLTTAVGLSIGWGDIYPYTLPDQFVDITGLPDGRYRLVVTADASGWFAETNEGNNFTSVDMEIWDGGTRLRVLGYGPNATIASLPLSP